MEVKMRRIPYRVSRWKNGAMQTEVCYTVEYFVVDNKRTRILATLDSRPWEITSFRLRRNCINPDARRSLYERALSGPYAVEYKELFRQLAITEKDRLEVYTSGQGRQIVSNY